MLKSHIKLSLFCLFLIILLLLNNFVYCFLNYNNLVLLLFVILFFYRKIFGLEKVNNRFTKEIILNMTIILLLFFIIYYLSGLFVGFIRTENFYSYYGFKEFVIPFIIFTTLKEYFRNQILLKSEKSKKLLILICLLFILFDITNIVSLTTFSNFRHFINFICLNFIPILASNVVAIYIAKKFNYKGNIYWLLLFNLHDVLLPIVPNYGVYITSIINLIIPVIIFVYHYYIYDEKRSRIINKKLNIIFNVLSSSFLIILVYLNSGMFRFYTLSIGSGSMQPEIYKGDVVIIDKKLEVDNLKIGDVIAYKYNNIVVVHRIVEVEKVDSEYYIYTKGDANKKKDDYIVHTNMIEGIVKYTLPYIGYPTIWLSKM